MLFRSVLHNPNQKNLVQISNECKTEAECIHSGKGSFMQNLLKIYKNPSSLAKENLVEIIQKVYGNFVISNFGSFGVDSGSLALSKPMCAGLCIGKLKPQLLKTTNGIEEIMKFYLTISFDHRIVDGAYVGQFMKDVQKKIERFEDCSMTI